DLPREPKWTDRKGDHWACLVKRSGDPIWVQLRGTGTEDTWTEEDEARSRRFRRAIASRPDDPRAEWKDLAHQLSDERLKPLEKYLSGIRFLIVLPSEQMAGVPVEALTNAAVPDRYTISYAPSGTTLAWLAEKRRAPLAVPEPPSLLGIGDPNFKPTRSDA